ncbi:MAG: hypothetical protein QM662_15035 [Gordonia sp. (in: high G+C Gram-positive bacteria)]
MTGGSAYEQWVMALRRWQRDPGADMSGLPVLRADSLPPDAYSRLFGHFHTAMSALTEDVAARFARMLEVARSDHDIANALIGLRAPLARRLQLCRHPALPPEVVRALTDGAERDITALQHELEDVLTSSSSRYASDRRRLEELRTLVRHNRITVVLEPGFPLESLFSNGAHPPASRRRSAPDPTPTADRTPAGGPGPLPGGLHGPVRRRVFLNNDQPWS